MSRVNPAKLLAAFAAINVVLCVVAAIVGGHVGLHALIASSFFMSIMFPTIFTMSLRGLGVVHQVGFVVPGDGHHRRRGVHRR